MSSKKTRSGLRLWPAYLILALSVGFFVWAWASPDLPLPMSRVTVSIIATACTLIFLLVWWFSKARTLYRLTGPCDLEHDLGGAASGPRVDGLRVLQSRDLLTTPLAADQGGPPSGGRESAPQ